MPISISLVFQSLSSLFFRFIQFYSIQCCLAIFVVSCLSPDDASSIRRLCALETTSIKGLLDSDQASDELLKITLFILLYFEK